MKQVLGIILLVCGLIAFIRFLPECHDAPTFFCGLIGVGLVTFVPAYFCLRPKSSDNGKKWDNVKRDKTMNQEQEEPIFEEISHADTHTATAPRPISGDYPSLKAELLEKCNPQSFMSPYDHRKIEIANAIYPSIIKCDDAEKLREFRQIAIRDLGVRFATQKMYDKLCAYCDLRKYSDKNNYDAHKVELANGFLQDIRNNADNIVVLEDIYEKIKKTPLWSSQVSVDQAPADDNGDIMLLLLVALFMVAIVIICVLVASTINK